MYLTPLPSSYAIYGLVVKAHRKEGVDGSDGEGHANYQSAGSSDVTKSLAVITLSVITRVITAKHLV